MKTKYNATLPPPIIWLRHPATRDIRYFRTKLFFYFHMSIVNGFRNKIVSAQRNIHSIQILCRVPPKRGFFVRRKHHAHVRSVFHI